MDEEMIADAKQRMDKTLEVLRKALASVRTGRASLAILDGVTVDYYGSKTPLNQIANMAVPEGNLITVQPWEPPMSASGGLIRPRSSKPLLSGR